MFRRRSNPFRQAPWNLLSCISRTTGTPLMAFDQKLPFQGFGNSSLFQTNSLPSQSQCPHPPLIYQWQEGVEDLEAYCFGGYHPTHIGDRYSKNRYEIVHKLGFGSYSTVWLAKDYQKDRFVSLKIIAASVSQSSTETKILGALASAEQDHPGQSYVMSFLDEFTITGPNGRHQCIVSEALGCSAAHSKDETMPWKFPANAARAISAQVLLGLDYIHSCNIVHGDLHSNNILFRLSLPHSGSCSTDDIYRRFGEPLKLPVRRLDECPTGPEAPKYCVPPARVFQSCGEIEDDIQVVIADFGEAFLLPAVTSRQLHTPILLLPPEFLFNERLGSAIDIWTLGCTLYNLLGERHLFEGFMPDENHAIAEMISTLGSLPRRWWDQWHKKADFFLQDGSWKTDTHRAHAPWSRSLTERLKFMGREAEFSSEETVCLEKLLRAMLAYEPAQRITAEQAVASEWMRRWGLPAIHQPTWKQ